MRPLHYLWLFMAAFAVGSCGGDSGLDTEIDAMPDTAPDPISDPDIAETTDDSGSEVIAAAAPELEPVAPAALPVPTATGLPLISGFTVNAQIQPHGNPASWHIEYGPTSDYGTTAPARALPGQLTAHFTEDWANGLNGWNAGFSGKQLVHHASGGPDDGPFVRYSDDQGAGNDTNHLDGIGLIHLGPYAYLGNYYWAEVPPLYLGGGFPDLRGATLSMYLRGVEWDARETELGSWIQGYRDPSVVEVLPLDSRYPNWAFTGDPLTPHLASGDWELAEWTLRDRTADWTFAGSYGGRLLYDYGELDTILRGVNVDFFIVQILHVDINDPPTGAFDSARPGITYRQHSVCAGSNGGSLVEAPADGGDPTTLSDGWRHGPEREWQSVEAPLGPQTFVYAFERPVTLTSLNVSNAIVHPSKEIEVSLSEDGGATWLPLATTTLPEAHALGPNYAFYHLDAWVLVNEIAVWAPIHPNPVNRLRVVVLSGYDDERWGLGEIEAFGTGAVELTDNAWYDLSQDVRVAPGTWHFRVVAASDVGTTVGPDQVVVVAVPLEPTAPK